MTFEHWLHVALAELDPGVRTRLSAEYSAHFQEARDATGDDAQGLAALGDPSQLNAQLRGQYLTTEEAGWLARAVQQLLGPRWTWGLVAAAAALTALHGEHWQGMWGLWVLTAALLLVRVLARRLTSVRRAALVVMAVLLPFQFLGVSGPLPQDGSGWGQWLLNGLLLTAAVWALLVVPRWRVWRKVFRLG